MPTLARYLAALAILVAGCCTTAMNWRFSYQLGTNEFDGTIWAVFSVALDVAKWLMLPFAAVAWPTRKLRAAAAAAIWLTATIYSFTAAIGFAALNRAHVAAEHKAEADRHQVLLLMRQSPRWQSSAACSDATVTASKEFCARYRAMEATLKGTPADGDAQAVLLARIAGVAPETATLVLCVFLAVACEVISALGFLAILPPPAANRPTKAGPLAGAPMGTWRQDPEAADLARRRSSRRHPARRHRPRNGKAPGSYSGGRSFSGGVAVVGRGYTRSDPGLDRRAVPGDAARSELYPLRELPGLLQSRYVLMRVRYAIDRLQSLLVDEPKVRHRNISVLGSIAMLPG